MKRIALRLPAIARSAKAATLAGLISLPLLGGLVFAFWPSTVWHRGSAPSGVSIDDRRQPLVQAERLTAPEVAEAPQATTISRDLRVASGDTLMAMLTGAGVARQEAFEAIAALRDVFNPRSLRPGQEIRLELGTESPAAEPRLLSLALQPDVERDVRVAWSAEAGYVAEAVARPLRQTTALAAGSIESNLSADAAAAGVPLPVLTDLIRIFSFDVDFQRDIQPGDGFEVLYDAKLEPDGSLAKTGDVLYAALTLSGKRLELYGYTPKSGVSDFFDTKGQSVRKTLMRTPIDGARLSSRFGMRKHPILGYTRMHRGTDFAAPAGTPIYAAGDGTIQSAGRKGAYGKYVRIRHNSTYDTAYAHMSRIATGMRAGARVRQGQIIGYVGTTGRSTGPHLHYEVLVNGKQVNPSKIKLASGEKLKGDDLANFHDRRAEIDALRGAGPNVTQTVKAD
ncbi:MAG TPA: peptidoglycan DD-metalloendopeptidase family protein [Kiloniellales bacterium]